MSSKIWAIMPQALEELHKEKTVLLQNSDLINSLLSQGKQKESRVQGSVAVINIEGGIYRKKAWFMFGTTHRQIKSEIEQALQNSEVKAILYNIYSPGGTVAGTQELASYIKEAAQKKPSAAFVDGQCCSAAYWLASATGRIFATESAELGSIGVVLMHTDYSKLHESIGLKYTFITAGSKKSVGAGEIPLSEDDRAYLQNQVNAIYGVFLQDISQNMSLDMARKTEWADGRVFIGKEAVSLGLVSRLVKTREEAMKMLLQDQSKKENEMTVPNTLSDTSPNTLPNPNQAGSFEQPKPPQAVSAIDDDVMAIIETVCGEENAQKVKALAQAGITKSQIQALGAVLPVKAEKTQETASNEKILSALMEATPKAVHAVSEAKAALSDDEQALIERIGNMK